MASGTMWRSVTTRAVVPTVATAVYCSTCTARPPSRSSDCNCKTQLESVQAHPGLAVSYGPQQFWDYTDDDWEIAGDEERDRFVFGATPTVEEVEEASSDLRNAFRLGYFTGSPITSTVTTVEELAAGDEETSEDLSAPLLEPEPWIEPPPYEIALQASPEAPLDSAVLEAIHEFQHNPEARDIVMSLANDKGIWEAAMANEKVIEYRRKFSARTPEGAANGATEEKVKGPRKNFNFFSHLYWITKQAFANFIASFKKFMAGLFSDEKGPNDGKSSFLDRVVRAYTRLAVLVLSLVTFKRSAAFKQD